jgi:transcriptional regulator with XRE-family HTH domain
MTIDRDPLLSSYSVGLKLRTLRQQKRFTLSQLGAETGFSTALLSKLESNVMIPTLPTLSKICRTYGIGLGYFFCEAKHHSMVITRKAHLDDHRRERPSLQLTPLHLPRDRSKQVARIIEIPAASTMTISEPHTRTELTAYVVEGSLRIDNAGTDELLAPGDCVVLDTDAAVLFSGCDSRCRVLVVVAR